MVAFLSVGAARHSTPHDPAMMPFGLDGFCSLSYTRPAILKLRFRLAVAQSAQDQWSSPIQAHPAANGLDELHSYGKVNQRRRRGR
jgi:hypothetical protein